MNCFFLFPIDKFEHHERQKRLIHDMTSGVTSSTLNVTTSTKENSKIPAVENNNDTKSSVVEIVISDDDDDEEQKSTSTH